MDEGCNQQLKAIYGEQLVIYAAHATNLADNDIDPYWYNFKCATGIEIADHFDPTGLPVGMVNRNKLNGSVIIDDKDWGSALATILANPAQISLDISSTYNSDTRELGSTVKTEFVQEGFEIVSKGNPCTKFIFIEKGMVEIEMEAE